MANPNNAFVSPVLGALEVDKASRETRDARHQGELARQAESARANRAQADAASASRAATQAGAAAVGAYGAGLKLMKAVAQLRGELAEKDAELLEAKKALHGQVAIKDALKSALAEVAPEHELNAEAARVQIRDAAETKVTPDSPWWP